MTGFKFILDDDDDEGFEVVEEAEITTSELNDEDEETAQIDDNDEVIWEETED